MHPHLIELGSWSLSTYGVLLAAGFLLVVALTRRATDRRLRDTVPLQGEAIADWAVWTMIGGVIGARLLYIALNWPLYARAPLEIIALWHGGLIWYGGFGGGLIASWLFARRRGTSFLRIMDQIIPFAALGHAVGRVGCFFNACCGGKPTTGPLGMQFPGQPSPVIPTQLIEAVGLVVLSIILQRLQRPHRLATPGRVFGAYLVGYAVLRAAVEHWRDQAPFVAGLTLQQLISIGVLLIGLALLVKTRAGTRDKEQGTRMPSNHFNF